MEEPIAEETGNNIKGKAEGLKVRDYMDIVSELTGLIRDNNITNFQLTLSVYEANTAGLKRTEQRLETSDYLTELNTGGKNE